MQERVGQCSNCKKEIYCLDGFFNGVVDEDKNMYCFECADQEKTK